MIYVFPPFRLDTDRAELSGPAGHIALEPKPFALLTLLVENHHRVICKDEMIATVWGARFLTDDVVSTALKMVRRALNDDGKAQAVIRTVRGRGHRFVAPVRIGNEASLHAEAQTAPVRDTEARRDGRPTLAVLPFSRLGLSEGLGIVADALPAEIISSLSRLRWLRVIARESAFRFRNDDVDHGTINSVLGAGYCLSGQVEQLGSRLTIVVDLTDTRSTSVIWSERFDCPLDDIQDIRLRIVTAVLSALDLRIPLAEAEQARMRAVEHLDAWGLYHLGLSHMYRFNSHDNAIAGDLLRRATTLDANFASAFAALSFTSYQDAAMGFVSDRAAAVAEARAAAERAMALDPLDPSANSAIGRLHILNQQPDDGLVWLDRAVDLSPSYAKGHYARGMVHVLAGRSTEARAGLDLATVLSPLDALLGPMRGMRAIAFLMDGDLEMAADWSVRAAQTSSAHFIALMLAVAACQRAGQLARAAHWLALLRERRPDARASDLFRALPFADPAFRTSIVTALRVAGLPD